MKVLARQEPQALVSWLLPGVRFLGTIDKELQGRTVQADLLFRVLWRGVEIILHIEIQRKDDKDMARRVWEYNVMTRCIEPYPVYSVVIYRGYRRAALYSGGRAGGNRSHFLFSESQTLGSVARRPQA